MDSKNIQQILSNAPGLRGKLYARGFLFTDGVVRPEDYPFYGLWQQRQLSKYLLLVAPSQHYYCLEEKEHALILVGHAYNPFSMEFDENQILHSMDKNFTQASLANPQSGFWQFVHELTGIFTVIVIVHDEVYVFGDASGMQTTFYVASHSNLYISSHTNLLGDLLGLPWDAYVKELTHYRFFKLLGNSLPGDLTQFSDVKRLIPNHFIKFSNESLEVHRFYWPAKLPLNDEQIVDGVSRLLHHNLELIAMKWQSPAISLTGGCDSKTTLACAKGNYDKYSYFSYISSESEEVDAHAARKICEALGLKHTIYEISENDEDFAELPTVREILNWNTGNIRYSHPNDVRKRIFFADTKDFDVEVKSWASEIGRAYYSKRFNGRTDFGDAPTPRKCTTLYKFFLHNRKLVKKTDQVFADYLERYFKRAPENPIEWQEQFFWEFRVPSWNGLVITGEHRYSFDITIPYNNRKILELLLSAPIQMRLHDDIYRAIRQKMNPAIDETGIAVTNLKHTKNRERLENLYYILNNLF